jgi:hypothetical protein
VHNGDLNLLLGSWHWQADDSASEDSAMWRQGVVADISTGQGRGNIRKVLNREGTSSTNL